MQPESFVAIARKHRPTNLMHYVGNAEVKDTVKRYLKTGRPQSILLTGNSGCGKTTLGRLLEKEYLCEDWNPETGACGECLMCQAMDEYITTGRSDSLPDVYEIDATESSGKNDIDGLLSTIDYPAMGGGWKVYLLDEVHKLSSGAMNRLLKVLEEPPERVLMILCTTNPEMLLDTIKNRCQLKLSITKPSITELVNHLKRVCLLEDKEYNLEGLRMIASRADFVVRDSLNYLETVINTRGNAFAESVSIQFQQVSDKIIFDFYDFYLNKDYMAYSQLLYTIKTQYDFKQFLTSLTTFTIRGIYIINGVNIEGISEEELKAYVKLFKRFSIEDISSVLSSLKQMAIGDIEANFMSFIYVDKRIESTTTIKVEEPKEGIAGEIKFRNNNLERIEKAKLREGTKALTGDLQQTVSIQDMSNLFQLEKVSQ